MIPWKPRLFRTLLSLWPLQRGKQGLAHRLYFRFISDMRGNLVVSKNGMDYETNLQDRLQAMFYLTGMYEPETIQECVTQIPEDRKSCYLDIGGNVGLIALQLKAERPKMEGHLFEADKVNFTVLKRNIELNRLNDFTLNENAVSERSGEKLRFNKSHESGESGWGRLSNSLNDATSIEVISISIDDYLDQKGIQSVDLVKIDVEGAEEKVLVGANKSLRAKKIKAILCEVDDKNLEGFGTNSKKLIQFLESLGYRESKRVEQNILFLPFRS